MSFAFFFHILFAFTISNQCPTEGFVFPTDKITIEDNEFSGCSDLTGPVNLPPKLITIGQNAFFSCSGLTGDLIIPDSVTTIGSNAFMGCTGLTGKLKLPSNLKEISDYSFSSCRFTGNLVIPDLVSSIKSYAFEKCAGFSGQLTLPNGLNQIGDFAFSSCDNLIGILNIPASVLSIGKSAFENTNFDSITFYGKDIECGTNVFDDNLKCEVSNDFTKDNFCGLNITKPDKSSPNNIGMIVGIVVGVFVVLFIMTIVIIIIKNKSKQLQSSIDEDQHYSNQIEFKQTQQSTSRYGSAGCNRSNNPPQVRLFSNNEKPNPIRKSSTNTSASGPVMQATSTQKNIFNQILCCKKCRDICACCSNNRNINFCFAEICDTHVKQSKIDLNLCYFCNSSDPQYMAKICMQCQNKYDIHGDCFMCKQFGISSENRY